MRGFWLRSWLLSRRFSQRFETRLARWGTPPLGNRRGFHGVLKCVQRGVGHLCGVKRARAMQVISRLASHVRRGS
jgi:hypothetical protein